VDIQTHYHWGLFGGGLKEMIGWRLERGYYLGSAPHREQHEMIPYF
jgi:hypothetical protein